MNDLEAYQSRVNNCLEKFLAIADTSPALQSAMHYGVFNGGKRVRPVLVYATTEAFGGNLEQSDASACAVELIHSYSLIHDDLPAMDDDDLRRGKPATHIQFGEASAILAGDALQSLAFEVLARDPHGNREKIAELAKAIGPNGMAGGQMIDVQAVDSHLSHEDLERMHQLKTGALIKASIMLGACDYSPSSIQVRSLREFARDIGLAFQVRDDLLDELGTESQIGKTRGIDRKNNKPTYVSIHGIEGAQAILAKLKEQATSALDVFDSRADNLRQIANFIAVRIS
jgi:geranylgeranyl pyrophosphate synthase